MSPEEVSKIPPGLYKIHWTEESGGGVSLASVGLTNHGQRWLSVCSWTCRERSDEVAVVGSYGSVWNLVEKAELIISINELIVELDNPNRMSRGSISRS